VRAARSEACTLGLQLVIDRKTAKKLTLGKRAVAVGTLTRLLSGAATLKLKLTGKPRSS